MSFAILQMHMGWWFYFAGSNFGPMVGTYDCLLPFYKCTWGGGSILQVVGTSNHCVL